MRADEADLAAYYDQEAALRANRPIDPRRVRARSTFIEQLDVEERPSVIEVGSGPGRDAEAFVEAGHPITAVDLSIEHARLASRNAVAALQGSLFSLPFAPASFDAGWTMSTLVHIPDSRFDEAMISITSVLRNGAPLAVGLWGGFDREMVSDLDQIEPPRFFSLRSHHRARQMLGRHGAVERFDTWGDDASPWEYQFAVVRVRRDP